MATSIRKTTGISRTDELSHRINEAHDNFERSAVEALKHAADAGGMLTQVKQSLPHGEFTNWLKGNVKFSVETARGYMRVYQNWELIEQSRINNPDMSLREAIGLLAVTKPDHDQNGNALPLSGLTSESTELELPEPGYRLLGIDPEWGLILVIEAHPFSKDHIRCAVANEFHIDFDQRGINRRAGLALHSKYWRLDMSRFEWEPVAPATAENNPLAIALPEWSYPQVGAK